MMLYEYPEWGYNVYAEPDMTMEVAEPATSPWEHVNADPGESQAFSPCMRMPVRCVESARGDFRVSLGVREQATATWTRGSHLHRAENWLEIRAYVTAPHSEGILGRQVGTELESSYICSLKSSHLSLL